MPDSERLSLIEKAIRGENESAGKELLRLCEIELGMPDPSYTADTLRELRKKYPEFTFRLITGADSYLNFEKWKEWEWIESNFNPIAYPRPGYQMEETRKGWTLIRDARQVDISSTQLREKLNSQSEK